MNFTKLERGLWLGSVSLIVLAFLAFDRANGMTLAASVIGVTAILINAKGNPLGQLLMIIFSLLYGMISYSYGYYGEMMTYLGMTMPMAAPALISWLRNPFEGNRREVRVHHVSAKEMVFMAVLSVAVTIVFYFILEFFHTANIVPSTLSVTTSFAAVYLTFRRSPYFSLAYAANDVVLIVLWVLAAVEKREFASVVVCFAAFLLNDIYGFLSWKRMEQRQSGRN